jgi:hypothetical protein
MSRCDIRDISLFIYDSLHDISLQICVDIYIKKVYSVIKVNLTKALTCFFNGNLCLTFFDETEIKEMCNEFTDINMMDMINRSVFFSILYVLSLQGFV